VLNPQSSFYESQFFKEFLALIADQGDDFGVNLKQSKKYLILIKEEVRSFEDARKLLERLSENLLSKEVTINA
jgi:hypothetical protein